jgi:hypothetical protein
VSALQLLKGLIYFGKVKLELLITRKTTEIVGLIGQAIFG